MEIWPAIDIRDGKCVRLRQGDYKQETIFGDDPVEMAKRWIDEGARHLHLVDLDGAKDGTTTNFDVIAKVAEAIDIPCELGGGIRSEETIQKYLDAGVSRLVIGSLAVKKPEWFAEMTEKFPRRIVLGIDAKNGFAATEGWVEISGSDAIELAHHYEKLPLAAIVYTDIATDGMMAGPNLLAMRRMQQEIELPVIASGGVTSREDVMDLENAGMAGCIIGRALYEGSVKLSDLFT